MTLAKVSVTALLSVALSACSGASEEGSATGGAAGVGGSAATGSTGGMASTGGTGAVDLSSDPGSGMCTSFTPCGGDVLGTWRVESLCMDAIDPQFQSCPTAKTTVSVTGSLTFNGDGSYVASGSSSVRTTLPASCATLCAATSCTSTSDGGCACDSTMPINETPLAYAVDGNKLIIHPRADVTQVAYFCRQGGQILMRGYSTATVKYQYDLRL